MNDKNEITTVEYDAKIYQNYLNEFQKYTAMKKKFRPINYISLFLIGVCWLGFLTPMDVILQIGALLAI